MAGIPIFLSSDNNYAPFVAITIASICDNTKSFCNFYVLDSGITEENKEKICSLKERFKNFSIEFITIDLEKYFKDFKGFCHISKAMYARFLIPDIKTSLNKAIYLDVDILVIGDILKLYEESLNNYTIGAVAETFPEQIWDIRRREMFLSGGHRYFNSGVLLIDCQKWRQEDLLKKIITLGEQIVEWLIYGDQDILNKFFNNNYKCLPDIYNTTSGICSGYDAPKDTIICHYVGPAKPWHYYKKRKKMMPCLADYWKYAKMTPFYNELKKEALNKAKERYRERQTKNFNKIFNFFRKLLKK